MTSLDNKTKGVYRGRETDCVVASLLPGRPYLFQVRAHNRAGAGPWSDSLEVVSGAGAPGQPKAPTVEVVKNLALLITWEAPINNGAIIQGYQLQAAVVKRTVVNVKEPAKDIDDEELEEEDLEVVEDDEDDDEDISEGDDSPESDDEAETETNSRSESQNR